LEFFENTIAQCYVLLRRGHSTLVEKDKECEEGESVTYPYICLVIDFRITEDKNGCTGGVIKAEVLGKDMHFAYRQLAKVLGENAGGKFQAMTHMLLEAGVYPTDEE
jgi:hypothetical protein